MAKDFWCYCNSYSNQLSNHATCIPTKICISKSPLWTLDIVWAHHTVDIVTMVIIYYGYFNT